MKTGARKQPYVLLWCSLLLLGLGQLLLAFGREFIDNQQPIDWAHWLLLAGAAGVVVSAAQLDRGGWIGVARLLMIIGGVAFIGMAAIDLFTRLLPDLDVVDDALDNSAVALPFFMVGPSLLFVGLAALAIARWHASSWAAILLVLATLISGFGQSVGQRWVVVASFVLILVSLAVLTPKNK